MCTRQVLYHLRYTFLFSSNWKVRFIYKIAEKDKKIEKGLFLYHMANSCYFLVFP